MKSGLIKPAQSVIAGNKKEAAIESIRFPMDLGAHAIVFNFKPYSYNDTRTGTARITNKSIALPLPSNLSESFMVEIRGQDLEPLAAGVMDIVSGGMSGMEQTINDAFKEGYGKGVEIGAAFKTNGLGGAATAAVSGFTGGNTVDAAKYFMRSEMSSIFTGAGAAIDLATGTAINPHVTLTFNGVGLRKHSFEWTFSPQNRVESDRLKRIIDIFKQRSLPYYHAIANQTEGSLSRGLLNYPDIVYIFFVGLDQKYYWYFKPCMIENIFIDYAYGGMAVVEGGKPAVIKVQMSLTEATIHTREDYTDSDNLDLGPTF